MRTMRVQIDAARLFALWADQSLTRAEVARELGVTAGQLTRLAGRHGLPARARKRRAFSMADPTPDEIAKRAAECRARHMEQRRNETEDRTYTRTVSRWSAVGGA
jgi:transposase-like protein